MHFFLQSDKYGLDKEIIDLKYILSNFGNQYTHEYDEVSENDIKNCIFGNDINIPVGTIGFVGKYLEKVRGSRYMKPLEIPEFLRKKDYLHRYYEVCKFKDLPKTGSYFIKDASYLKNWEANVFFMPFIKDQIPKMQDDWEEHLYVCSSILDIIYSEYRVLVHQDNVVGVQYYSGFTSRDLENESSSYRNNSSKSGVLDFPDSDIIKSIIDDIKVYRLSGNKFPKSYTLDVAVTPRGTVLLEVHNFVSCGTYGYCDNDLIYMYRDGIDYELGIC